MGSVKKLHSMCILFSAVLIVPWLQKFSFFFLEYANTLHLRGHLKIFLPPLDQSLPCSGLIFCYIISCMKYVEFSECRQDLDCVTSTRRWSSLASQTVSANRDWNRSTHNWALLSVSWCARVVLGTGTKSLPYLEQDHSGKFTRWS